MLYVWLCAALFFLLLEMAVPGLFFFLSFFFGCCAAAAVSSICTEFTTQAATFSVVSAAVFCILRRWLKKEDSVRIKTNVYALQGKHGNVLETIEGHNVGLVKVGGEVWSAKTVDGQTIAVDACVEVVRVQGSHLIVTEIKNMKG